MTTTDRSAMKLHERALRLASEAIDADLTALDAAWLATHLRSCAECAAAAAEYRSIHDELRGLAMPEPPRDLWARTAAGLDAVDAARSRSWRAGAAGLLGFASGSRLALARAGAVGLTAAVASLALLTGGFLGGRSAPTASGGVQPSGMRSGDPAPVAFVLGNGYWVAPSEGVYQITSGSTECADPAKPCAVSTGGGTVMASVESKTAFSVAVAPDASQAAVWTADKIVILPLGADAPKTVSMDLLTPRPAAVATASPVATPTVEPSASVEPSGSPEATPTPSPQPTLAPEVASRPVAILDGYTIVGRAPEFSAGGEWVAFSARAADLSGGPDVYVWRTGWERAVRVTDAHADLFAGWFGGRVIVSEFVAPPIAEPTPEVSAGSTAEASPIVEATPAAPIAISFIYDPVSGLVSQIGRPMLLPTVDPTGRYLVYWSGTVSFNATTRLWEAGQGDLHFDAWSNLALVPIESGKLSATKAQETPSADGKPAGQLLPVGAGPATVQRWVVRWDGHGRNVAVWVGDPGSEDSGRVTLFRVDPSTGQLDIGNTLISAAARSNFAFDDSSLVYTSPTGAGSATYKVPVPEPSPTATPVPTQGTETPGVSESPKDGSDQQSAQPGA
jgi:hypothetical protein